MPPIAHYLPQSVTIRIYYLALTAKFIALPEVGLKPVVQSSKKRQATANVLLAGMLCVIIVVFSIWTYQRNMVWQDAVSLWTDNVKKSGHKARPLLNLGNALSKQGKVKEAAIRYHEALRIDPDYAEAHINLGVALFRQGRFEEAIIHYTEALNIKPECAGYNNLGNALISQGKHKEAIVQYNKALRMRPECAETHNNLGVALFEQGRLEKAVIHYQEALRIKPRYSDARKNLTKAIELIKSGRI